jgi:DNA polymerase-3 subunit epsilon
MFDFAEYYGEWNDYFQSFKWQKLSMCAYYFGYEFNAHDSLEDVKATLHCYNKINELKSTGEYQKRVDLNYQYVE